MNAVTPTIEPVRDALDRPLSIAVLAMGGQGGGVLTDWIVAAAEHAGWIAQSTGLLADALDMLSDATAYAIGLVAIGRTARFKANAAALSGGILLVLSSWSGSRAPAS